MELICSKNDTIRLKVVGNGKLSIENQRQIQSLSDRVEIVNRWIYDDEIYRFFEEADLVVMPYLEASQSGVIMLAYSFGKPFIVTDVGGLSEQVYPDSGVIIPPNDVHKLSEVILKLYSGSQKLIQMGDIAYQHSLSDFSWDVSASTLVNFISN